MNPRLILAASAVFAMIGTSPASAADPATINWASVPSKTLTLFYPAQSTYQWLRSSSHAGAGMVVSGGACVTCHNGQEEKLGNKLVKTNPLEPAAPEGKSGTLPLAVQIAYDNEFAYSAFNGRRRTRTRARRTRCTGTTARNGN